MCFDIAGPRETIIFAQTSRFWVGLIRTIMVIMTHSVSENVVVVTVSVVGHGCCCCLVGCSNYRDRYPFFLGAINVIKRMRGYNKTKDNAIELWFCVYQQILLLKVKTSSLLAILVAMARQTKRGRGNSCREVQLVTHRNHSVGIRSSPLEKETNQAQNK